MKTLLKALMVFFVVAQAQAYESDTHLRMSYILARSAGLSDSVAKYLSIGNQYVDETALTSAVLLSSQRQLYHFHGDAESIRSSGHGLPGGLLSAIFKSKLALAERNHALGSVFLYHGLVQGDLQLFSAGTHTKMDTFGHAGYSSLLGHAVDGHSPDRAFLFPKKYEDMIREMMATYVALKEVLPQTPEFIDNEGGLKYLNETAELTHLARKLTIEDMSNPVTIATVLLADTELQAIYREDIYKKYEYKKLALERVYQSFKDQGKINPEVTFNEVFSEDFIRNSSAETTDVIIAAILENGESDFMKSQEGKDIFDMPKLLEGQTHASFAARLRMEIERYRSRLLELATMRTRVETLAGLEQQSMRERIEQEEVRLLSGLGESGTLDLTSSAFIEARAKELGQYKMAEEIAHHLTKDMIPRKTNEYIKHQFEGNDDNREFENHYKDEAYRRFIHKKFGVNWIFGSEKAKLAEIFGAIKKFKDMVLKRPLTPATEQVWKTAAEKAAADLIKDPELSLRERAQLIGFTTRSKLTWIVKHLKYVAQATPLFYGYRYMKKLSSEAKRYAQNHTSEDIGAAVRDGKYKPDIVGNRSAAARNLQVIRAGTKVRCSYIMHLIGG